MIVHFTTEPFVLFEGVEPSSTVSKTVILSIELKELETRTGFEPVYAGLQAAELPLF